ncbi:uncharacterized protein LOC119672022 isoform X2 [Teleopsis dalmanni]|uniref:uncharacterized protein LOC119672022 isoform X2 n=1 Tax=Teleopsis dalmanni TaxID=139649 RepID=UPI0018CDDCA4|nr:uncharacterized protein LOC119672022 isoform X2 [Teleopsis dalmanni]
MDEDFRAQVTENAKAEHQCSNIVFEEITEDKQCWVDESTTMLIAAVKELQPLVGTSLSFKSKKRMWNEISERLCAAGYHFTALQVESKFYAIKRQYKKKGRNKRMCASQKELEDILGEDKASSQDYFDKIQNILSSTCQEEENESEHTNSSINKDLCETQSSQLNPQKSQKSSRSKKQKTVIEQLQEMHDDRKKFEAVYMEFMLKREANRAKEIERRSLDAKRRDHEKIKVMKSLVAEISTLNKNLKTNKNK